MSPKGGKRAARAAASRRSAPPAARDWSCSPGPAPLDDVGDDQAMMSHFPPHSGGKCDISEGRRETTWKVGVAGVARDPTKGRQLPLPLDPPPAPRLERMNAWEEVSEDYRATGINLGEHPLSLLREGLGSSAARASPTCSSPTSPRSSGAARSGSPR
jgi:hypothetical protein